MLYGSLRCGNHASVIPHRLRGGRDSFPHFLGRQYSTDHDWSGIAVPQSDLLASGDGLPELGNIQKNILSGHRNKYYLGLNTTPPHPPRIKIAYKLADQNVNISDIQVFCIRSKTTSKLRPFRHFVDWRWSRGVHSI